MKRFVLASEKSAKKGAGQTTRKRICKKSKVGPASLAQNIQAFVVQEHMGHFSHKMVIGLIIAIIVWLHLRGQKSAV